MLAMLARFLVVLLQMSLVPVLTQAQPQRSQGFRPAGGFVSRPGHVGIGAPFRGPGFGLAPFTGFGNINHPGLGFAPNTPGIGFPLTPTRPAFGLPLSYGSPWGYPYPSGSYYNLGFGYGWGGVGIVGDISSTAPQAPAVIIIQQPQAAEGPLRDLSRSQRDRDKRIILSYESRPASAGEKPLKPLTLLVFKDHSLQAVSRYWKEGNQLYYVTSQGGQRSVSLDLLDLEFTKKANAERNVRFEL